MLKLTASLMGEKMSLEMSFRCKSQVKKIAPYDAEEVLYRVRELLERQDSAEYLLNDVKIGSTVAIVDEAEQFLYMIEVGTHDIMVENIFYIGENHPIPVKAEQPCIFWPLRQQRPYVTCGLTLRQLAA